MSRRFLSFVIGLTFTACAVSALAQQNEEQVIYAFQGTSSDGLDPQGGLIADAKGNLYGVTYEGLFEGSTCGTVFELSPPSSPGGVWTQTVLHAFTGIEGNDGCGPQAPLVFDKAGNLYGTTLDEPYPGQGIAYELSPPGAGGGPWSETILHTFMGGTDGADPNGGLVFDKAGNLYGSTAYGGSAECERTANYCGTIFELSPPSRGGPWTETVLFSLSLSAGWTPNGQFVMDSSGKIYGTTQEGGLPCKENGVGCGTVFVLIPPPKPDGAWTKATLYAFAGGNDGAIPHAGVVLGKGGVLYGTTLEGGGSANCLNDRKATLGCGTVFELAPPASGSGPWTETVLHVFTGLGDGAEPQAELTVDPSGNLYGTTYYGGIGSCPPNFDLVGGCGTAFRLTPPLGAGDSWNETALVSFQGGNDGSYPISTLLFGKAGVRYGTTTQGGSGNCSAESFTGCGTVFEIDLPAQTLTLSPPSLSFGSESITFTTPAQVTTLTNLGSSVLSITNIGITGADYQDFAQTNNCPSSLPSGASCTITVTFTPTEGGTRTAAVSITDSGPDSPQTVPLTGMGLVPAVTFSPTSLTFPPQLVFTKSEGQGVTLTNTGNGNLRLTNIVAGGNFHATTSDNSCRPILDPGYECAITVYFTPTTFGQISGTLTVTDSAPNSPQTVPLTGTGAALLIKPTSLEFGTQPVGTKSLPKRVTVTNKADTAVTMQGMQFGGNDPNDFAQQNNCGNSLAAGGSCFIEVTFTPLAKGKRTATLVINDNGGGSPQIVSLEGSGT